MKKQIFLLLMSAACATSYAQLSVNSDGQVAIGAIQDSTFVESDSKSNVHIYGATSESSVKLSLGPGGSLTIEAASTNIKRSFAAAKGAELKILKRTKN